MNVDQLDLRTLQFLNPDFPRVNGIVQGSAVLDSSWLDVRFRDADGGVLDDGLALWFRAPASYTGEDVVELQAHGSPPVLQALVERAVALGARRARAARRFQPQRAA